MNNTSCVANIEVSASIVAESKINRDDVTKVSVHRPGCLMIFQ